MAIKVGDNFSYQGQKPNFDRDSFDTLAAMKAFPETSIDEGHISYCKENGKNYQYKSANSVDTTTGKWREFSSGSGGDGYVIDYITSESGTITEEQYNSIINAITNNIPIYIIMTQYKFYNVGVIDMDTFIVLSATVETAAFLIYLQNDYSYELEVKEFIRNPMDGIVGQVLKKTSNGVAWQNDNDTKYNKATQQTDGLMSKEDKVKLDGLTGASLQILTQEEYDATEPKAEDTIYFIKG